MVSGHGERRRRHTPLVGRPTYPAFVVKSTALRGELPPERDELAAAAHAGSTAPSNSLYRHRMYLAMLGNLELILGLIVLLALGLALRRFGARGWLVLGALMLTCFVTNPDKAKHAAAVKDKIVAQESTAVGRIALDMAAGMVEPLLQYSNLGLLSITTADGNLVSVGLLNQVFVPGSTEPRSRR